MQVYEFDIQYGQRLLYNELLSEKNIADDLRAMVKRVFKYDFYTIGEVISEYRNNAIRAELKFKGKKFITRGLFGQAERDYNSNFVVELRTPEGGQAEAKFDDLATQNLLNINFNDKVLLFCDVENEQRLINIGIVKLKDCGIIDVEDYISSLIKKYKEAYNDIIQGNNIESIPIQVRVNIFNHHINSILHNNWKECEVENCNQFSKKEKAKNYEEYKRRFQDEYNKHTELRNYLQIP